MELDDLQEGGAITPIYGETEVAPAIYPAKTGQGWGNAKNDRWAMLSDAYTGAGGFASATYLVPHRREEKSSFSLRKIKARYANDYKSIINALVSPIFRKDAVRTWEGATEMQEEILSKFLLSASLNDNDYPTNMKTLSRNSRKYDTGYVMVGAPKETAENMAELSNKLPYLVHVTPGQVVEQVMTDNSVLELFAWAGTRIIKDKETDIVYEYTPGTYRVYIKRTLETIELEKNALGYVPVFPLWAEENEHPSEDPNPKGTAYSLATIALRRYNLASIIDEISDGSAYPLLAITGDSGAQDLDLGINNALVLPEAGSDAKYLQPDYKVLTTLYDSQFAGLTNEMYTSANVLYMRDAAQSAESRQQEGERTQEILGDFAKSLTQVDSKVMQTVLNYLGFTNVSYEVSYGTDFGNRSMEQDIEAYKVLKEDSTLSPVARELIAMRITKQLLAGVPDSEMKLIEESMANGNKGVRTLAV